MTTTFRLIEGFDVYPSINTNSYDLQARWASLYATFPYYQLAMVSGRFAGSALATNGGTQPCGVGYPLTAQGSGDSGFAAGFAYNLQASSTNMQIAGFKNLGSTGTGVIGIGINSSQQPYLFSTSTSTILATATSAIATGGWHYYELVANISTSGSATLYIDGVAVISYSGNLGALTVDYLTLGPVVGINIGTYVGYYDDLYVASGATRIGEARVETLLPNANGSVAWTPLSGSNYSEVNSLINHGSSAYVYTATVNASDLYSIGSLVNSPTSIFAVQTRISVQKTDASSHTIESNLKSGTTTVHGATFAVPSSFLYDIDIFVQDPNTSAAWTASGVNAAQIGQTLLS